MLLMKETKSSESGNIKKLNAVKRKKRKKKLLWENVFDTFEEEYSNHSPKPHSC